MVRPAVTLPAAEYARRRRRLLRALGPGAVAILPAAPHHLRNRDSEYPFRQDSDFQYLTGFPEPEALAVFIPGRKEGEYILFCRVRDVQAEVWTGRRAGQEGARAVYGADESYPIAELDERLPALLENRARLYCTMGHDSAFDQRALGWVNKVKARARAGVRAPAEFVSLDRLVHELRLFKSPAEVAVMRRAAVIAADAHVRAMRHCRSGMMEWALEAEILHEFRRHGAVPSYNAIVGGGANACILHYTENNAPLRDGELVLIDAGAEWDCYASDITRTFPVNGRFSPAQRAVYEVVLAAQHAAIAAVRPGKRWIVPHDAAVRVLTRGLVKLGLLQGELKALIHDGAYRRFYMHRTGHWLGMDVHDVGDYQTGGKWRMLEPGMVLTVEPGLYIPAGSEDVPKKFWDIGIRIEDDVLVTKTGCEVLTAAAPKTVEEIEALMARPGEGRVRR